MAMRRVPKGETSDTLANGRADARLDHRDRRRRVTAMASAQPATGTPVIVDGQRAPLVGRVSMDMIAVDVTDLPPVRSGTCVRMGPASRRRGRAPCAARFPTNCFAV